MIDQLAGLTRWAADWSLLTKAISLVALPFAHEDLAIVLGGYIIVNKIMPVLLVGACVYAGMVASDFALYGIGAGARHIPWLGRYAVCDRVREISETLKHNIFSIVALCRVVPGVVFVAFVACGWARVSLLRFAVASLVVSAFYLPLMLYLVITFGDALDNYFGIWAWPLLFAAFTSTSFVRNRIFGLRSAAPASSAVSHTELGMPALAGSDRKVALAERIPPFLFYVPLVFNWMRLGFYHRSMTLPTAANPGIFTGGMWGESKSHYFHDVASQQRQWIAGFVTIERSHGNAYPDCERAFRELADAGLDFPLIAKPDIGWHGYGVCKIDDAVALRRYISNFPEGATIILQRFVPYAGEAAALYARLPGEERGRILSLTFRYFPHVIGDGSRSVRQLIQSDPRAQWKASLHLGHDATHAGLDADELARVPAKDAVVQIALIGNQRAGALYRDGRRHITPALEARIDAIASSMPEFHYGRFDLRYDTVDALMRGEDFSLVEINGIGGEAIDVWDPSLRVSEVYRRLARHQSLLFTIGGHNRARGFKPTRLREFATSLFRQTQLIKRYPASA